MPRGSILHMSSHNAKYQGAFSRLLWSHQVVLTWPRQLCSATFWVQVSQMNRIHTQHISTQFCSFFYKRLITDHVSFEDLRMNRDIGAGECARAGQPRNTCKQFGFVLIWPRMSNLIWNTETKFEWRLWNAVQKEKEIFSCSRGTEILL
jgi:hypothetical protein